MGIKKESESNKITGDKFESTVDRAASGPPDRKRRPAEPEEEAEELDVDDNDDNDMEDTDDE
jgi:hypothetical protein